MAAPTIRAVGAGVSGTTSAVTAAAPTGVATGDLEILVASTQSGGTITLTTNGGSAWTALSSSPVDPGVATTSDKLYIWWRIRQSGDGNPTLTASADHIMTTRVAITGGTFDPATPIEIDVSGTEATSDTSFSFAPGNSTAGPDRLLFVVVSSGVDSNTGQAGTTLTNANTTSNTIQAENQTVSGGGGGFWIGTGIRATAGAVGTWTNTMTAASPKGYIGFAVRPYVSDVSAPTSGALDTFNAGANQALTARSGWRSSIISGGTVTANTDAVPTYAAGSTTTQAENAWGTSSSDQEVWVKFGSVIGLMWLYTRIDTTPGAQNYYELESDVTAFKITRSVGGVTTALRTVSHGLTRAAGDQLCLRSKGAYHEVWYKTAAGSWTLLWAVYDESTAGPGYIGMDIGNASPALRIDEFGGGPFGPGTDALTFTSTGTSASTFNLNRRRPLAFTSAGTSTSSFALALVVIGSPGPYYGPQILNEGLNNNRIGLFGWKQANKERLEHGGSLLSISAYVVGTGAYGAGTGGSLRCRVETDNGSGRPSGTLVATGAEATLVLGRTTQVSTWTFGTPPTVTQGQLVHFVWDNVDASPTVNYVSIDNIDVSGYEKLPQPTIPDSDRFVSLYDSGAWIDANDQYYPIFRTLYGDGYKGGQSHYECGTARYMGGTQKVRQKITPTASHTVRRVNVAVARYPSTTNDLTLTLRNLTASTVLDTRTIPVGAIHQAVHATPDRLGYRHVGVELSAPVTLSPGTVYALELSSAETVDPYMTAPTRIGGVPASFGALFDAADRVPDMLFEYTTDGSTWLTETGQSQALLYFHTTAATTALAFTSAGTSASTFNLNRRRGLVWAESSGGDSAVLDDFNSGAGGNVSARAGWDAGALWSGETTLVVNSVPDAAVPTAAGAFRSNVWGSSFTDAECWAEVGALGAGAHVFDLGVRVTAFGAGASTYYAMEINLVNGDFTILKYVAGSSTPLATNAVSVAHVAGDAWKIRVIGSTITAWRRTSGTWAQQTLSTGASVTDSSITGSGRLAIEVNFADATVKVNEFGGGTFTNTTGGVGSSVFNLTTQHASGTTALAFTSAGTSASTFTLNRRRPLTFTSSGTSASTFALNRRRPLAFTSTGTSASTFALNRRRTLTFTSTGTSTSTFTLNRARPLAFTSAGTSASTFSLNRRRAITFTSAGTSTSTFVLARRRALTFTSAGTSASTFTLTSQHAPAIIALAFTSAGTSTSSFTLNRRRPLSFTSAGTSASAFALNVRRGLVFTSTGTSTSTFALSQRRALTFTSAGTSTSVFALNRRRPLTFASAGTSTSTFTLVSQHAPAITPLAFTSTGTSTSNFALNRRRPLTFTSSGTSTSSFALTQRRALAFTSTGASTSTFSLSRRRALAFTSTGTSTSTFALNRRRTLAFTSAGTSTSSFALNQRRALTFTSTGTSTSTFALTQRRALTFTSTGVGTSTFSLNRRRPLSFTSTGTSTSTFTLATQHVPTQVALAFTSTGTSTSTFVLTTQHALVKREMTFASAGVGTSTFAFRAKRALAFTSSGTSTSTFSFAAKRALTFTSAGVGTSTFTLTRRRALSMTSSGVGTSTFTLTRRRALAFLSSGLSASSFAFQVRPGLHLNSTGVGTSTFTFTVIRNVGPILTAIIACADPRSGVTSDPEPEPASTFMSGPSGGILSSPRPGEVG